MKGKKRSLILKYFTKDVYIDLLRVLMVADADNNERGYMIKDVLRKYNIPFSGLGSGTNRMAVLIDGYAVKIALDADGKTDSKREFLYTKALQPYVIKVYECTPDGLISVNEFVDVFTLSDFHQYQDEMREILEDISRNFLVGDVGINGKNYTNYGIRKNGQICILDFAYIYSVKYQVFNCTCDDTSILRFDDKFINLICPMCGRKYTFGEIRRRITRVQQEEEIGDIRRLSYNLHNEEEEVELIPEFEPKKDKKKKELSETEKLIKLYREGKLENKVAQDWDTPDQSDI